MEFTIVGNGTPLPSGYLDLLALDDAGTTWVIELKRTNLGKLAVDQALRYLVDLRLQNSGVVYRAMVAGPGCSHKVKQYAQSRGVSVHLFDMDAMEKLAAELNVRDLEAAPKRKGTARRRSETRGPGKRLADRGLLRDRQQLQHELDHAFPPGTLTMAVSEDILRSYWSAACPTATSETVRLATIVTLHVFSRGRGSALSNRASSWSTIRYPDGGLCAAVDTKKAWVQFDFLLPSNLIDEFEKSGTGRRHHPRMGGVWAKVSGLGRECSLEQALAWFDRGIKANYG